MMLELTDGGRCMSGMDAIEFFERLDDVLDEDVKTEQFCDELTWALNRLRVEVRQSIPIEPKKMTGRFTSYSCGQCGHGLSVTDKYCPECGRGIKW